MNSGVCDDSWRVWIWRTVDKLASRGRQVQALFNSHDFKLFFFYSSSSKHWNHRWLKISVYLLDLHHHNDNHGVQFTIISLMILTSNIISPMILNSNIIILFTVSCSAMGTLATSRCSYSFSSLSSAPSPWSAGSDCGLFLIAKTWPGHKHCDHVKQACNVIDNILQMQIYKTIIHKV